MSVELLWTDKCFLFVLVLSVIILLRAMRKEHIRLSFQQIFKKPLAVSAAIILLFFLIIGVLDSIHVKTATQHEADSLLDRILAPLSNQLEQTYSAPLALTLYASETKFVNGKVEQIYPRLNYPPASIKNADDVKRVVVVNTLIALLVSTGVLALVWVGIAIIRRVREGVSRVGLNSAALTGCITLLICLTISLASYWISRELHLFGTGKIGQDIFYQTVKSIRTGLVIGILTTLFMMPLALLLGIAAGYFGGFIDDVIQYVYTTLSSIPGVLLITASVLSMQTYIANNPQKFTTLAQSADARLLALCFILGVTSWTSLCRLLRAEALKLREVDFVLAAQALGSSSFKIIMKHLLPNVMHIIVITVVLDFSFLVLAEAVLSYVGVGVSPLTISWGNMINAARLELAREPIVWWPMMAAFIFMFVLVLASNLFADAVRDAFDPRQSNG